MRTVIHCFTNLLMRWMTAALVQFPMLLASRGASPLPSNPAAAINDNTGTISANLNQQGQYVVAVRVTEFKTVLRLLEYSVNTGSILLHSPP